MISTSTLMNCDVCEKEMFLIDGNNLRKYIDKYRRRIQIIFTTEQTEGRDCTPYIGNMELDVCDDCKSKILKGRALFAYGAQGYNKYFFQAQEDNREINNGGLNGCGTD